MTQRFLAACLFVVAAFAAAAEPRAPAGYLTAIEGEGIVAVERAGQRLDAQVWTPLFDGDQIVVEGRAAATIETARDKRQRIEATASPYLVRGELPTGGRMAEFRRLVGDLFRTKERSDTVNLVGRTEALRLAFGANAEQSVSRGAALAVAWRGGTGPFAVELRGQSNRRSLDIRTLASVSTDAQTARIGVPTTASGSLLLVVRDAAGQEASARILLQSRSPKPPDWLTRGAPTSEFAQVARALWLLERPSGHWELEAARIVAELDAYPPARALFETLAAGEKPQ